jgi:segregation and condensation protein B
MGLSRAALEVLAIVAYRQPIARSGIELIRGSASDSALDTLLQRGLIADNPHHLFVTTVAFLDFASIRDLADLPTLNTENGVELANVGHQAKQHRARQQPAIGEV